MSTHRASSSPTAQLRAAGAWSTSAFLQPLQRAKADKANLTFPSVIAVSCIFAQRGEHQGFTFVKELPSLTRGTVGNSRFSLMVKEPALRLYRLDITSRRSEVVLTGRKRLRGTFIPREFSKLLIAAPTAVSSWITFNPPSRVWKRKLR